VSYLIQASAQDYLNESDSLSTFQVNLREGQIFTKNFQLTPTLNSVKIDNIYYDFDKATLRPESKAALDRLIQMMNEHPNITIELSAHTDYKGNNDYNRDLSARRAQSVVDYLIKAGIDGTRLKAVGYGKLKPYVVDATTAKNYDFLPQGTELTQEFIETLTPEQQETANQINRRTEFKILSTSFGLY
jgi:peptidoglycan-associated lipoprotein